MYRHHTHCRACGLGKPSIPTLKHSTASGPVKSDDKLIEVLDLGLMPLANDFCASGDEQAGFAPLKLLWCPRCTLAQLSVVVRPDVLYKTYPYVTSKSATMKAHFEKLTYDLMQECHGGQFCLEIGSNDGTLLEYVQQQGFKTVLGIEPAENLADAALKKGINTSNEFFGENVARGVQKLFPQPDLIIARHVFCHIDDWYDAIAGLDLLCGKDTVIAIEVPYLVDTIKNCEWDQVYHEHLSYMTVKAMQWALKGTGLWVHKVNHYDIHGGAIVMIIRLGQPISYTFCLYEPEVNLEELKTFSNDASVNAVCLGSQVRDLVASGKTVVGYGASAKATQWIHQCGFSRKQIKYVCDETSWKQYKNMPGSDIPVVDPGALTRDLPDYAICFAWNFAQEIMEKEKIFMENGGKWIIPNQKIQIVSQPVQA